ncbi:uncharacterized protein BXZ73DRAFT_100140 [Epithele typhae]|uniref:uncharacterized protein n=1 Tax=Epithele typhae TaxID=378194 RepID=UPI002008672F|nr:uncharacterized protein BXZ73DRAFT_100140 [Epithele typhae]KAH9937928.1 hypothetical protein BXZ73DRAFT_100140 [Epithele typhae]
MWPPFGPARRLNLRQLPAHAWLVFVFLWRTLLFLLRLPAVPQLLAFYLIWCYANLTIIEYLGGVWDPGFPKLWTAWIAFLVTLPTSAALKLAWLLVGPFFCRRLARKNDPEGG